MRRYAAAHAARARRSVLTRAAPRPLAWVQAQLAAERDRFPVWLPVFMGAGVLAYFSLRTEPPPWLGAALLAPTLFGWTGLRQHPPRSAAAAAS